MRWVALGLGAALAASGLAWALVTTGHWPLDDRREPAPAFYAMNGALGQWLLDHGREVPQGAAGARAPGARGGAAAGLTPAELEAVERTLRTDPRYRDRHRFTPVPAATSGRG
ncbi:MAG TPA: hypothetical protein VFR85_18855 [Anaeromyxobacteraceae bacterium]|nr:hypothetical protein [Anaeromyxobacteraceae bacterium]